MASGHAGGSERRGAAYNPYLLAGATRMTRVWRLEHDPQPELWRPHTRPWFLRLLTVGGRYTAGNRMSLKGVGRPRGRLGVTRDGLWQAAMCPFPLRKRGFQAVAGCPNAANPDSQPSAALTYGGCGGLASDVSQARGAAGAEFRSAVNDLRRTS